LVQVYRDLGVGAAIGHIKDVCLLDFMASSYAPAAQDTLVQVAYKVRAHFL
jgi:hypothetical protein